MAMHAITELLILQEKRMNHWKRRILLQGGKKARMVFPATNRTHK
jgi:hypothetical protein